MVIMATFSNFSVTKKVYRDYHIYLLGEKKTGETPCRWWLSRNPITFEVGIEEWSHGSSIRYLMTPEVLRNLILLTLKICFDLWSYLVEPLSTKDDIWILTPINYTYDLYLLTLTLSFFSNFNYNITLPTPLAPRTWHLNTFLEVCFLSKSIFLSLVTKKNKQFVYINLRELCKQIQYKKRFWLSYQTGLKLT